MNTACDLPSVSALAWALALVLALIEHMCVYFLGVCRYPFIFEFWPKPVTFSRIMVSHLPLGAHAMLAAIEVAPGGFVNMEIAQKTLANSTVGEGRVIGLACPICGETFGDGRPLRMHLQSPRHGVYPRFKGK